MWVSKVYFIVNWGKQTINISGWRVFKYALDITLKQTVWTPEEGQRMWSWPAFAFTAHYVGRILFSSGDNAITRNKFPILPTRRMLRFHKNIFFQSVFNILWPCVISTVQVFLFLFFGGGGAGGRISLLSLLNQNYELKSADKLCRIKTDAG